MPAAWAQQSAGGAGVASSSAAPAPGVNLEPVTEYPSMLPVLQIRVNLNSDYNGNIGIWSLVDAALSAAKPWDCKAIASYDVEDTTTKKRIAIANLRLEGSSSCTMGAGPLAQHPAVVLVLKDHQVGTTDKLTVALANLPSGITPSPVPSGAVTVNDAIAAAKKVGVTTAFNTYSLTIAPQAAPSETLTTGAKRDTGQLAIAFSEPEIAPSLHVAALGVSTTDLFSTDERDAKSAFAATLGLNRGLSSRFYLPGSLQLTAQGNQVATSLGLATAANVGSLVPAPWTNWALYNYFHYTSKACKEDPKCTKPDKTWQLLQAPSPIEWTVSTAYTHRIRQVVAKGKSPLAEDDYSLNPSLTLTPIYVLPNVCSAYQKWINGKKSPSAGGGGAAVAGGAPQSGSVSKQYCLGLQTDIGLWYLPLDKTKAGSQQAEGYGDISFLIPLTDIPFSGTITNLLTGSTSSTQLHIKYADDVNAANNYARTKQWTFAFELIK
jgi:hypothetical protein